MLKLVISEINKYLSPANWRKVPSKSDIVPFNLKNHSLTLCQVGASVINTRTKLCIPRRHQRHLVLAIGID